MSLSEWLVRNIALPAHEQLRGRDTFAQMRALDRWLHLDVDAAVRARDERLRAQLRFAAANIPFYTARLAAADVDVYAADPVAELRKLPVLDKPQVREHQSQMVCQDVPGGPLPAITSGSAGDPLRFFIDRQRAAETMGARLALQTLFGVLPGDRRVYLWGSPIETRVGWVKRWRNRLLNEVVLSAFDMGPADMDRQLRVIQRYRPRLIYSFSSAISLLAQHAAQRFGPADFDFLKVVVGTGEPVTADQRDQVQATFGCRLLSEYGARESGLIAHECPCGSLHVLTRNVVVEILDGAGRRCAVDEPGEVVCTPLSGRAQPLLRYRQGDYARWAARSCPCGWPLPVLELENSRVNGFIALPDGRRCSGVLASYMCRDHAGVRQYRLHQRSLTRFELTLAVGPEFERASIGKIEQRCRHLLDADLDFSCTLVDEIPPHPSGKRSGFISDIAADYTHFTVVEPPDLLAAARPGS